MAALVPPLVDLVVFRFSGSPKSHVYRKTGRSFTAIAPRYVLRASQDDHSSSY